ncbi:MAG: hypothetical protein RMX96_25085 [Nostoc sp. ChiSLP02]|nr:hypothetical protein [Nostoc sp. DedSLP05]MDZ8099561.1 hypothetical protein [Nostoc sp. DedSLP01]MDZ8188114.1 hypothetical protein [Nostoc sp. ChiSLP02]
MLPKISDYFTQVVRSRLWRNTPNAIATNPKPGRLAGSGIEAGLGGLLLFVVLGGV